MLALGHISRIRAISYSRIHTLLLACRNHCRAWYIEKENAVCVRGTPSSSGNIRDNITHVHALLGVLGCPLGDGDVKTGLSRITDMREMWRRKDLWGRHRLFEIVLSCQLHVCTVSVTFQKESNDLKKKCLYYWHFLLNKFMRKSLSISCSIYTNYTKYVLSLNFLLAWSALFLKHSNIIKRVQRSLHQFIVDFLRFKH